MTQAPKLSDDRPFCVTHQTRNPHPMYEPRDSVNLGPCKWSKQLPPPPGTPNRRVRQRALFMLQDFEDSECRLVLERLVETAPEKACTAICEHWESAVEAHRFQRQIEERQHGIPSD